MLKQSKIILKSLTSFCWHPYWSRFIRSLRNVRLNKIWTNRDQQDYITKAQTLLQDSYTYKLLPKDPTSHLKNKLITLLKDMKQIGDLSTQKYKQLYPTSAVPPSSMASLKSIKQEPPSDPLFPVGGPSHMGLPRSFSTSSNPW